MPSVADQLRRAREAQGLSLHQLAELTKIRTDHLRALEEADYHPFPASIYIRGSVRTCASFLKIDGVALLAELDAELANSPEFSSPPSLTGETRGPLDWLTYQLSRVNWRWATVIGIALVLIVGSILGWRAWVRHARSDPLGALGPGLYRPPQSTAGEMLPIPTNSPPRR